MAKRKDFCLKFQISHIEFGGKILQYASNFFFKEANTFVQLRSWKC